MSLLLGIRGASTQKNEEKPFRESGTQQSGSLFTGDPSPSIWGDSLASPNWHANVILSPSTSVKTASPSFFPASLACETYETMENGHQKELEHFSSISSTSHDFSSRRKGKEPISGQESGGSRASKGASKQFDNDIKMYSLGANTSNERFQFDEYSNRSFMFHMPHSAEEAKVLNSGVQRPVDLHYTRMDVPHSHTSTSTISSEGKEEIVEKSDSVFTSGRVDNKNLYCTENYSNEGPKLISEHREAPGVFVFGASMPSSENAKHSVLPQRMSELSSSRTRSKFKRQVGGSKAGFGSNDSQSGYFSFEDAFPLESSHTDDAKDHSNACIGPEDNQGRNADALLSSEPMVNIGIDNSLLQDQRCMNQQDFLSQYGENEHVGLVENFEGRFSSLFSSNKKPNEESRQRNDHVWGSAWGSIKKATFFNKSKNADVLEEDVDDLISVMRESGDPQRIPDSGQQTASSEKGNVPEFLHQIDDIGENLEILVGQSCYKGNSSNKEIDSKNMNIGRETEGKKEKHEYLHNIGGNGLPKTYAFGSQHAVKTQVELQSEIQPSKKDDMQETKRILKDGSMQKTKKHIFAQYVVSNQADQGDDTSRPASSSSAPFGGVKNFGSLIEGSAQSNSPGISMNVKSSFPNLKFSSPMKEIPHNEFPTGEFSGPVSSSESSDSECTPSRTETSSAGDVMFHQKQCFEFQGNLKNSTVGLVMGKKKVWPALKSRRQRKGLNKQRNIPKNEKTYASVTKDTTSTMDFSPRMENTNPADRMVNLEQPFVNLNNLTEPYADSKMEDRDDWMQFMENQSMEDLRTATANLSITKDQNNSNIRNSNHESGIYEESNEWARSNLASKRSGSWKRSDFEEGQSVSSLGNPSEASRLERENSFEANQQDESYLRTVDQNQATSSFTFGAHSHVSMVGDTTMNLAKTADHITLDGSFDKKGSPRPVRRTFSKINQSSVQKKNTEEAITSKVADPSVSVSTNFADAGVLNSNAVKSAAAEKVCEGWRLRGNLAYENGDFPKAEEYYSRGASSISPSETSQSCIRASMLCYSNRAATRMAVGRIREALADCKRAMVIDSSFSRVRLRAANCHLALGESKAATAMFKECVKHAKDSSKPDSKILGEAMEGAKKAQQLDDYSERALQLLLKENSTDSTAALRLVNEALSISPYSELLHELKTRVFISLKRYEEAVQLCEQSLPVAERSHGIAVNEQHQDNFSSCANQNRENLHLKQWRWRLSAKCLYYLGKLDEAIDLLKKHESSVPSNAVDKDVDLYSLSTFMDFIQDLSRHKAAGNEAFQLGKHAEAVEHYSAALACNGESRPYNAMCFCNRAAASQALGHIADAIADCSRAIALDSSYPKALSRRATLHEMIRDYGQACNDLRRLIILLEDNQSKESKGETPSTNMHDLKQAQDRLAKVEEEMKKGAPIDYYMLLGVDSLTCSANEIKKAYRKAALKHHPDKASQFLKRENGDAGSLWKEIGVDEVRADAERLFKLIGEANAILSDPAKRARYNADEMQRKIRAKNSSEVSSSVSELFRSQYERSGRRQRDRWDVFNGRTYDTTAATQHQRWQSAPDAAQPDIYARNRSNGSRNTTSEFSWDDL